MDRALLLRWLELPDGDDRTPYEWIADEDERRRAMGGQYVIPGPVSVPRELRPAMFDPANEAAAQALREGRTADAHRLLRAAPEASFGRFYEAWRR